MQEVLDDFNAKIVEVNTYFDFLVKINNDTPIITYEEIIEGNIIKRDISVNAELQKILKANGFLLLYNLIESTFKDAIKAIFISINKQNLKFKDLTSEVQKLWINQKVANLGTNTTIISMVENIAQIILDETVADFDTDKINKDLSGSIDARKIRETANKYGFSATVPFPNKGDSLVIIKNNRNHLAHGSITFGECGKNYTITDLIKIKRDTIDFMTEILKNIKYYIINNSFCVSV